MRSRHFGGLLNSSASQTCESVAWRLCLRLRPSIAWPETFSPRSHCSQVRSKTIQVKVLRVFTRRVNNHTNMNQGIGARPLDLSESESVRRSTDVPASSDVGSAATSSSADAAPAPVVPPRLVWVPRSGGKRYHRQSCGKLRCARRVEEIIIDEARARARG